jgi:hypothetical protein
MPIPPLTMMMRQRGIDMNKTVRLTDDERHELIHLTKSGKAPASQHAEYVHMLQDGT